MLAGTKLIAEAWDAGGLYQVGSFVGDRWAEWNGVFRDDVRRSSQRPGHGEGRGAALPRQPGHLRAARPGARRSASTSSPATTGSRSRISSGTHQAQRGQRRGQPRRQRPEPELELRRRGADGRSRDRGAARAADPEPARVHAARLGRADAAHGRRGAAHPGRQQQRLLPRRRRSLVRLDADVERHADMHRFTRELIRLRRRLVPLFNRARASASSTSSATRRSSGAACKSGSPTRATRRAASR